MDSFAMNLFSRKLLEWASVHLRDYPWRHNRTFYRVFIAELFLQRTKADQVAEPFRAFVHEFPDFEALKSARRSQLIPYFRSLGLVNRAEIILKIAKIIMDNALSPDLLDDHALLALPGVGYYILNAIRCFAQNQRRAIVDSNVVRLFGRYFNFKSKKATVQTDPEIWAFASSLMPEMEFVSYNYALIDFGSLICAPKKPRCSECPLHTECHFFHYSLQ